MDAVLLALAAFGLYVLLLTAVRTALARRSRRSTLYAGGEAHPDKFAQPGYGPFYVTALFFAVVHLGALVLATGALPPAGLLYLGGLALALIALLLG